MRYGIPGACSPHRAHQAAKCSEDAALEGGDLRLVSVSAAKVLSPGVYIGKLVKVPFHCLYHSIS